MHKCKLIIIIVLLFFCLEQNSNCATSMSDEEIINYIPLDVISTCDSNLIRLVGNPDSADISGPETFKIRFAREINYLNKNYLSVIAGCIGNGVVALFDESSPPKVILSDKITFPTHYVSIGGIRDINNDSIPELILNIGSGSHGMYIMFLSIYESKLIPLIDEKGHNQFFASGGGINLKDLDNDGTLELILTKMIWPSDTIKTTNYKVYKWNGTNLQLEEELSKKIE